MVLEASRRDLQLSGSRSLKEDFTVPMPVIEFDTGAFGQGQSPVEVERGLHKGLEFLAQMDRAYLIANPNTKPLYQLGLRYIRDPVGKEVWRGFESLIGAGGGDCKSLAAARIAELRIRGEPAQFVLRKKIVGDLVVYHVQVRRADGAVEDPSSILGMRDAFDLGVAAAPPGWRLPPKLAPFMPGQPQVAPQNGMSPKVAGIVAAMTRRAPAARVGLEGMQLYQICDGPGGRGC